MPHLPRPQRPAWASTTTSSSARGYGAEWRKLRARKLKATPWCEDPYHVHRAAEHAPPNAMTRTPRPRRPAAVTVDHLVPKSQGGTDAWENLMSLCQPCHNRKTSNDRAKIGRGEGGHNRSRSQPEGQIGRAHV